MNTNSAIDQPQSTALRCGMKQAIDQLSDRSTEAGETKLLAACDLLMRLVALADETVGCNGETNDLEETVGLGIQELRRILDGETSESQALDQILETIQTGWGEYLELLETQPAESTSVSESFSSDWSAVMAGPAVAEETSEGECRLPSAQEISQMLASISRGAVEPSPNPLGLPSPAPANLAPQKPISTPNLDTASHGYESPKLDDEIREAFLDDAGQCMAAIEAAILTYESDPNQTDSLRLIGRELHTLKGASASIGLTELAEFLHQVEDSIGSGESALHCQSTVPNSQELLGKLDHIRQAVAGVQKPSTTAPAATVASLAADARPAFAPMASDTPLAFAPVDDRGGDDESVRVKSSQLNRLMDMLAELVMLRNRRETELAELQGIYDELIHDVCRVRAASDSTAHDLPLGEVKNPTSSLAGVANHLMATAQRLRACSQPVAEGNAAVSQFIRQFRQELVELRRTPVSGLFRRLQRVVRDAAHAEEKQVRLQLVGEDAGTERSLQQRLYEPLLHIVRNCVCHGIETTEVRQAHGKQPCGTITLQARSGADLFVIEIRDDGQGLNYDAIRRRALESGLLKPGTAASNEELAQLIFQPGFSTRHEANQVAGRGVGMDVVADTLKRMRGWVEVDSEPGRGTCIRLSFPVPSVIQHTMVFRSAGQLYALPMQFVQAAGANQKSLPMVRLEELLPQSGISPQPAGSLPEGARLVLACHQFGQEPGDQDNRRICLVTDDIVGPEEVVVRPMPPLLKHHPVCCGATLSGQGETVLVLDVLRVLESASQHLVRRHTTQRSCMPTEPTTLPTPRPKILVVDDSRSSRLRVLQSLSRYDVEMVEAKDGKQAMELMKRQHFSAVFSDLEMPEMDGLQLLSAIRSSGQEDSPPVVIISSRDEAAYQQRASELGAADYLIKPLADDALDRTLAAIESLSLQKAKRTTSPLSTGDPS